LWQIKDKSDQQVLLQLPPERSASRPWLVAQINTWVKDCLFLAWLSRDWAQNRHREQAWQAVLPEVQARINEPGYPEKVTFYGLNKDQRALVETMANAADQLPPELTTGVYPPGTLARVMPVFYLDREQWLPVDAEYAAALPTPVDPRVAEQDQWVNALLGKLQAALALPEPVVWQRAAAQYPTPLPWYTFTIGIVVFTMGPRKRVFSIQALFPQEVDYAEVEALAAQNRATFNVHCEEPTQRILVHGWASADVLQYLTILGRLALALERNA
jgi:hypothetical protein